MARESCKGQIAVLEMNGQSVPQRWTSIREGSNTARRQCSAWDIELSAIRRAKVLASRESGYRVAHSRQVVYYGDNGGTGPNTGGDGVRLECPKLEA